MKRKQFTQNHFAFMHINCAVAHRNAIHAMHTLGVGDQYLRGYLANMMRYHATQAIKHIR